MLEHRDGLMRQTCDGGRSAAAALTERGVLTELLQSPSEFYAAEWYHQRFWLKNWCGDGTERAPCVSEATKRRTWECPFAVQMVQY